MICARFLAYFSIGIAREDHCWGIFPAGSMNSCIYPDAIMRSLSMRSLLCSQRFLFFAIEHGGDAVSGGGHPSDSPVPAQEAIDDAFGQVAGGHGKTPGVGVPGSRTNPADLVRHEIALRAYQLWQEEGSPDGHSEDFWLRAENELLHRS
jgi:hypothetical protein